MKKRSSKDTSNTDALALPIASRLEQENSRRKKKDKNKRRQSSSGPRPIPDDIPEELEIDPSCASPGDGQELVEWNTEQTYDGGFDHATGDDAIIERIDSYTDSKGGYKSYENPIEDHHLSDMWKGVVANYDDQGSQHSGGNRDDSGSVHSEHVEQRSYQSGDRNYHDNGSYRSDHGSNSHREAAMQDDSISDSSDNYCAKEDRKSSFYGCDDDQSSTYDDADITSTNSGIAALNDYNASRNKLDHHQSCTEDEDDAFVWSEEEQDQKPSPTSTHGKSKRKPWHRKEINEHSFVSSCGSFD
jgi:hypothetical protein